MNLIEVSGLVDKIAARVSLCCPGSKTHRVHQAVWNFVGCWFSFWELPDDPKGSNAQLARFMGFIRFPVTLNSPHKMRDWTPVVCLGIFLIHPQGTKPCDLKSLLIPFWIGVLRRVSIGGVCLPMGWVSIGFNRFVFQLVFQ